MGRYFRSRGRVPLASSTFGRSALCTLASLVMAAGCAQAPIVRAWQPWTRTLQSEHEIPPNASMTIHVDGNTDPLLGDEALFQKRLADTLGDLLERRGFHIDPGSVHYSMKLQYSTRRHDVIASTAKYVPRVSFEANYGVLKSTSFGVAFAKELLSFQTGVTTAPVQDTHTYVNYSNVVSVELSNTRGGNVWKGEAMWDSPTVDPSTEITPALQLILSTLPSSPMPARVRRVSTAGTESFYRINCAQRWFSCPALPYRITFDLPSMISGLDVENAKIPSSILQTHCLAAYLDLVNTAEFALPTGSSDYSNPLRNSLWNTVRLGGSYIVGKTPPERRGSDSLGTETDRVDILIDLRGSKSGYGVRKCWVADREEFARFEKSLTAWREALKTYYSYYDE